MKFEIEFFERRWLWIAKIIKKIWICAIVLMSLVVEKDIAANVWLITDGWGNFRLVIFPTTWKELMTAQSRDSLLSILLKIKF
jgi:hypothetical protein